LDRQQHTPTGFEAKREPSDAEVKRAQTAPYNIGRDQKVGFMPVLGRVLLERVKIDRFV
jgi:hypothetical protein